MVTERRLPGKAEGIYRICGKGAGTNPLSSPGVFSPCWSSAPVPLQVPAPPGDGSTQSGEHMTDTGL